MAVRLLLEEVLTLKGLRDLFVLVFLHVATRRVFDSPATYHPNEAWVQVQAAAFMEHAKETGLGAALVMHDRDTKFTASFDDVLKAGNVTVQKSPFRSPNTVAFVERFIQTIQQECLDDFVVFGERHMNHLTSEFIAHYHAEWPHQGKAHERLIKVPSPCTTLLPTILCFSDSASVCRITIWRVASVSGGSANQRFTEILRLTDSRNIERDGNHGTSRSRVEKAKPPPYIVRLGEIECQQQLGGLLKHCHRKAA